MTEDIDRTREIAALSCEVSPGEVDAGADMSLIGKVACSPPADLSGRDLLIKDHDGELAARIELSEFDGGTNVTKDLVVKAPATPGAYTWLAVFPADANADEPFEESSAPFSFTVKPHSTHVAVWDVPPAIERGEKFNVKVGVKCSSECRPDGWALEIRDHDKQKQATAALSDDPWSGTTALYFADVELIAPDTEGLHAWEAVAPMADLDIPHAESLARFNVRVVPAPECLLTIVAIDEENQTPVKGAKVVVHPYRAVTDERGVAELRVPKGQYRIFVSGGSYFPFRSDGDVQADMSVRAELALDLGPSDADVWS